MLASFCTPASHFCIAFPIDRKYRGERKKQDVDFTVSIKDANSAAVFLVVWGGANQTKRTVILSVDFVVVGI